MSTLRVVFAVVLGIVLGSVVNMALIWIGGQLIHPPSGADMTTADGIRAALPLLQPRHFLFPFLAHALGTLAGAFVAARFSPRHKLIGALLVGAAFFVGGILAARMIPAPDWFVAVDLIGAYFPTAWLGYFLALTRQRTPSVVA